MNSDLQLRDLTWAVNSCPLIECSLNSGPQTGPSEAIRDQVEEVERAGLARLDPNRVDREHLAHYLEDSTTHRVGRYFERLILYWIQHVRGLEIVAESLPIREGNRTIGEIDLLFRDEQRRLTHWEMAVKFYLYFDNASSAGSCLIGPNAADTFERKLERLFEHQLPRSKSYFPDVKVREAFVKGRIFYHPDEPNPTGLPHRLSRNHLRSVWVRSSELALICDQGDMRFRILRKPRWLSEERADPHDVDLLTADQLRESLESHFCVASHPILVSRIVRNGVEVDGDGNGRNALLEKDRVFVVSTDWPERS